MSKFEQLYRLDVNSKTDKKKVDGRENVYLSWAWAWSEFVRVHPDATYEIVKNPQGLPYFADETGAMVYTKVSADGIEHEMWLPVMNGANKAMKNKPYTYSTKYGEKDVEAFTMFDINKTIMRCLTKNLAMFGLGLYIYAKEDLPEETEEERLEKMYPDPSKQDDISKKRMWAEVLGILKKKQVDVESFRAFLVAEKVELSAHVHLWLRNDKELLALIEKFKEACRG